MYYQLDLDARSPYRYYARFRSSHNPSDGLGSYFSIEIEIAEQEWGTLLENNKLFSLEVCQIMKPETLTYYDLRETNKVVSQNVITEIGRVLVDYKAIPEGVPFQVNIELEGKKHSFTQMNSKVKTANDCPFFLSANHFYCDFANVPVNNDDEIDEDWYCFEKGTDRFEVLKWFEESYGFPIVSFGKQYAVNELFQIKHPNQC